MKTLGARCFSVIMILALCVSLWNPVGYGSATVQATQTDETPAEDEQTENKDATDGESTEISDETNYEIVLVDDEGTEITELKDLVTQSTMKLQPKLKKGTEYVEGATFTYTSADNTIATVSEDGTVTAVVTRDTKTVDITIRWTDESDASVTAEKVVTIKVIDIPVSLAFYNEKETVKEYALEPSEVVELKAKLVYASGKEVELSASDLNIVSDKPEVVSVDAKKGTMTAANNLTSYPQEAHIKVTYKATYQQDGETVTKEITEDIKVYVVAVPVKEIKLKNDINSITMKIGDEYVLYPYVVPSNASNKEYKVKSSDKDAVSAKIVDNTVVIKAKGMAKDPVTITVYAAENSAIKATFTVNLYQTVFNVAELGVNGTDTSSDGKKLNDILWYATCIDEPVTVVVPDGTYYIDRTLKIYSQTNLVLSGNAVMRRTKGAGDKAMIMNRTDDDTTGYGQARDIVITGGTWDGNADGSSDANCIYMGHAQNITINNTKVINNSGAHLIEFAGVYNGLIENVELYGYVMCNASGYTSSQADKEAIQLDYCSSVSAPAMKPYDGTACDTITIRNCNIYNYMSGIGTHTSMGGVYSKNIRIENNTFTNITNACVDLRNFQNVTISGNKARGFTTFLYASGSSGSVTNNDAVNTSYTKMTSSGLYAANAITVSNGSSFSIEKNVLQKAKSNGICVWNGSTATIKNNKIKNNKLYGIRTQGSTVTLKKNTFSKNKKGLYHTYKDAKIKSSDDIRAYYIDIKKSYKYKGKPVKPKIKIKGLNKKYYKVSYKNNNKIGKATVIIKGKGKVKKTLKVTFKIKK